MLEQSKVLSDVALMKVEQRGEFGGGGAPELVKERKQRRRRSRDAASAACWSVRRLHVRRCELLEHLPIDAPVSPHAMCGKAAGTNHVIHRGAVDSETICGFGQSDRGFLGVDRRHATILSPARTRVVDGRGKAKLVESAGALGDRSNARITDAVNALAEAGIRRQRNFGRNG